MRSGRSGRLNGLSAVVASSGPAVAGLRGPPYVGLLTLHALAEGVGVLHAPARPGLRQAAATIPGGRHVAEPRILHARQRRIDLEALAASERRFLSKASRGHPSAGWGKAERRIFPWPRTLPERRLGHLRIAFGSERGVFRGQARRET
jgi:hypothetical protein